MFYKTLLSTTALVFSINASATTLNEMLEKTLEQNPTFKQAEAAVDSAVASKNVARADFLPQISATGSVGKTRNENSDTATKIHPRSYSVTATQSIFKSGQNYNNFKSARRTVDASEYALEATKNSVLNNAASAYLNVLTAQQVHLLNEEQVKVLKEQLRATKLRYEVGEVTQTDVRQAEARAATAKADLVGAEAQLETARAFYMEVSGLETIEDLSWPRVDFDFLEPEYTDLLNDAMETNPNILAAKKRVEAAKHNLNAARGQHFLDIEAQATYSHANQSSQFFNGSTEDTVVKLNATLPIFQGGRISAAVDSAKAAYNNAQEALEAAKRTVKREFIDSYHQYRTSRARFKSLEESLNANRLAYEGVAKEAEVGQRTTLDVLDARQEYLSAQVDYIQGRNDIVSSSFKLAAAMGALSIENVNKYVLAETDVKNGLN